MKRPRSRRARAGPYRWSCFISDVFCWPERLAVAAVRGRLVVPAETGPRCLPWPSSWTVASRASVAGGSMVLVSLMSEVFTPSTRSFFVAGGF